MALANGEVELAPGGNATLVGLTSENYGMESSLLRERGGNAHRVVVEGVRVEDASNLAMHNSS